MLKDETNQYLAHMKILALRCIFKGVILITVLWGLERGPLSLVRTIEELLE
jgi:hypothetical protein